MAAAELRKEKEILAKLRKQHQLLSKETEELRKTVAEVCHAAIVIQKSYRKFLERKKCKKDQCQKES